MNRYKRKCARATRKSIRHSCLAEYWAWQAKIVRASVQEELIDFVLDDLEDFARRSCSQEEEEQSLSPVPPGNDSPSYY